MNSFTRTALATCFGVVLAVAVLLGALAFTHWVVTRPGPLQPGNPAMMMQQRGYWRDHATMRWYTATILREHGCTFMHGLPTDAYFKCQTPLDPSEGIASE
jgi:hypothetical protein